MYGAAQKIHSHDFDFLNKQIMYSASCLLYGVAKSNSVNHGYSAIDLDKVLQLNLSFIDEKRSS